MVHLIARKEAQFCKEFQGPLSLIFELQNKTKVIVYHL